MRQLDWWQQTEVQGVRLVAAPAQHFSGRGLTDGDRTLWASWVILAGDLRLFFSGDTGYHADFKTIGERYGPFDVTMLETGAYDAQWPDVHMQPEQTLQAHRDLKGRWLMPVHNGTFDLAMHAWHEPFDRIHALARGGRHRARHAVDGRAAVVEAAACGASLVAGPSAVRQRIVRPPRGVLTSGDVSVFSSLRYARPAKALDIKFYLISDIPQPCPV